MSDAKIQLVELPRDFQAGADIWSYMACPMPFIGGTPTAILGVGSLVSQRRDGGLIVEPDEWPTGEKSVVTLEWNGAKSGHYAGFTIINTSDSPI